ncbi:MAG: hypothetical protein LC793_25260 [Thermomicrobia bacterium]|nr:hypothetical protein [Thermomicrobia bacterium]
MRKNCSVAPRASLADTGVVVGVPTAPVLVAAEPDVLTDVVADVIVDVVADALTDLAVELAACVARTMVALLVAVFVFATPPTFAVVRARGVGVYWRAGLGCRAPWQLRSGRAASPE